VSEEQTLRLVAQVVDKFSAPIAEMRKSLGALSERNIASHKAGKQAASAHEKAFVELRKAVKETGEHVKGILAACRAEAFRLISGEVLPARTFIGRLMVSRTGCDSV
jgi:hypothetical protein